jgi:hypothetical protein
VFNLDASDVAVILVVGVGLAVVGWVAYRLIRKK